MKYQIRKLQKKDYESIVSCIQQTFPAGGDGAGRGETMAEWLAVDSARYLPFTEIVAEQACSDSTSYVLENLGSGQLKGFLLGWDYLSTPNFLYYPIHPSMQPLIALLEKLDAKSVKRESLQRGVLFHCYMLGLTGEARGHGYGELLIEAALENAAHLGFQRAIAEATGVASQKLVEKLGFEKLASISYKEFEFENQRCFDGLQAATECQLVQRDLSLS